MRAAGRRYRATAFLQSSLARPRRENLKLRPPSLRPDLRLAGDLLTNRHRMTPTGALSHRSAAGPAAHAPSRSAHAGAVGSRRPQSSARPPATESPAKYLPAADLAAERRCNRGTRPARRQRPTGFPLQVTKETIAPS